MSPAPDVSVSTWIIHLWLLNTTKRLLYKCVAGYKGISGKHRVSPRLSSLICFAVECWGVSAEITGVRIMGSSLRRKCFSVVSKDRLQRHDSLWQILFVWPPDSCNWQMEYHYPRISHQTRGLFLVHGLNHAIILHEPANPTTENLNFYDWASICSRFFCHSPKRGACAPSMKLTTRDLSDSLQREISCKSYDT